MQTFVPFADFEETARSLDSRRLGKQRPRLGDVPPDLPSVWPAPVRSDETVREPRDPRVPGGLPGDWFGQQALQLVQLASPPLPGA